jgi:transcription elongation factor Elf1
MIVREYTCPNCGFSKYPTNHLKDDGRIVKVGGEFQCEVCGDTFPGTPTCVNCDKDIPASCVEEVDMQM